MNKTILTGEIKVNEHISALYEHCPECKDTRCILRSGLCTETVEIHTPFYPGHKNLSIESSLQIDLRELVPFFEIMLQGKAPKGPIMVSTIISE